MSRPASTGYAAKGIRVTAALEGETCAHHLLRPTASARPTLSATTCWAWFLAETSAMFSDMANER